MKKIFTGSGQSALNLTTAQNILLNGESFALRNGTDLGLATGEAERFHFFIAMANLDDGGSTLTVRPFQGSYAKSWTIFFHFAPIEIVRPAGYTIFQATFSILIPFYGSSFGFTLESNNVADTAAAVTCYTLSDSVDVKTINGATPISKSDILDTVNGDGSAIITNSGKIPGVGGNATIYG